MTPGSWGRRTLGIVATAWCLSAAGCASPGAPEASGSSQSSDTRPAVTYSEIAASYNARVARLECFRASLELKMTIPDETGELRDYESEGNLQFVAPARVALRIDKAAQVLFWLGSNETKFWWLDLSGERGVALVGSHDRVDPIKVDRLGVPVRPLDLLEVLGILPLPRTEVRARVVVGVDPGTVVLVLPSGPTVRRMVLEASTLEPRRIELIEGGRAVIAAELERYAAVRVQDDVRARPTSPTRVVVTVPATRTRLIMNLYNVENPGTAKIKPRAFELEALTRGYGVEGIISLDRDEDAGREVGLERTP